MLTIGYTPEYFRAYGRSFRVHARFPDTPAGTDAANNYMETCRLSDGDRLGVIDVSEQRGILLAAMRDEGVKIK